MPKKVIFSNKLKKGLLIFMILILSSCAAQEENAPAENEEETVVFPTSTEENVATGESSALRKIDPIVIPAEGGPSYYSLHLLPVSAATGNCMKQSLDIDGNTMPLYRVATVHSLSIEEMDGIAQQYACLGDTEIVDYDEIHEYGILSRKTYICESGMEIQVSCHGPVFLYCPVEQSADDIVPSENQLLLDRYGKYLNFAEPVFRLDIGDWEPRTVIQDGSASKDCPLRNEALFSTSPDGTDILSIRLCVQNLGDCLGEYPVISLEDAEEKLLSGDSMAESDGPRSNIKKEEILSWYVAYFGGKTYNTDVYQPVYVFLVEAPDEIVYSFMRDNEISQDIQDAWERGEYYVCQCYYVPAVEDMYLRQQRESKDRLFCAEIPIMTIGINKQGQISCKRSKNAVMVAKKLM